MHGPCMPSHAKPLKIFEKKYIHIQGHKFNSSILKYEKFVYFQNVVNRYLTQAYNAIPAL